MKGRRAPQIARLEQPKPFETMTRRVSLRAVLYTCTRILFALGLILFAVKAGLLNAFTSRPCNLLPVTPNQQEVETLAVNTTGTNLARLELGTEEEPLERTGWSTIVKDELSFWKGRSFNISVCKTLLRQVPNSAMFHVTRDGSVHHVEGLQQDWHFNCFLSKLLRPAAKLASVDTYLFLHGWDEPVGRQNEVFCDATYGHQHANLWNPHVPGNLDHLPFLVNGKVRECHTDILIPQEHICEHGVDAVKRSENIWDLKVSKAFWRGSSTGFGTPQTNHRARVVRGLINSSSFDVGLSAFAQNLPPENELLKPPVAS